MALRATGTPKTAADVMTPAPRTCSTFSTVLEAVMIFRDADCGAVPVLEDGKPVGMLTDRDVALALADYPDLVSRPVTDIMTRGVVAVPPDASLEEVRAASAGNAVRRVLVVDSDDRLLGVIAWSDMVTAMSDRQVGDVVADVTNPPNE